MFTRWRTIVAVLFPLAGAIALAAPREGAPSAEPALQKISYTKQVKPIFEANCAKCHLGSNRKGGLSLETRDSILKGGENGAVVEVHKSDESSLITLLTVDDPEVRMPKKGKPLPAEQIDILKKWIDQGMPYDGPAEATTRYVAPLAPRKPAVPAARDGLTNPIDLLLVSYFEKHKITPPAVVDDRTFARRVWLDTIGLLPPPAELEQFISDRSANKRAALVDRLLARKGPYAEHWLSFWNDALRNDYEGPGYIDGGRQHITPWLYDAIESNKPYDVFVRELIAPKTEPAQGFIKGILWRGAVSASQARELQAAQNISQVFLGINMKCASCHDSFINEWKLADAYGLAGVFADKPMEMFRCEKPLGESAPIKFLYPELGAIDAKAPREKRQDQLAALMTDQKNGRFARTIVNRLWAKLMGRGLVEPVDEMDNPPWSQDVLDHLASDLVENKYDLKKTLAAIMTSRAYQLPAVGSRERDEGFVFRGPTVRRMSAEQYYDALSTVTGIWPHQIAGKAMEAGPMQLPARWIWSTPKAFKSAAADTAFFRKTFQLQEVPDEGLAVIGCDNGYELFVNGQRAAAGSDFKKPDIIDLKPFLVKGKNVFAVVAQNFNPDLSKPPRKNPATTKASTNPVENPAGFFLNASIRVGEKFIDISTNKSWRASRVEPEGWMLASFDDSKWKPAEQMGGPSAAPWRLATTLAEMGKKYSLRFDRVRAVWARNDALMTALGRPNRDLAVTHRDSPATMLQFLELTNGATITRIMTEGGKRATTRPTDEAIAEIYRRALGRAPTARELDLARTLIGSPAKPDGISDLLWAIAMLPEFQLIY